jgi:hypothetical protein
MDAFIHAVLKEQGRVQVKKQGRVQADTLLEKTL